LPGAEHGFKRAVIGLILGFVLSIAVSSILSTLLDETGKALAIMINLLSIIVGLTQLEKAKHWSLSYIIGYFLGLFLIGRYLMEDWELLLYMILIVGYILQKIARKANL